MRIYVLPVPDWMQSPTQNWLWPPGNEDWGVEQDWLHWLMHSDTVTDDAVSADWHYLPIFWNRLYLNEPKERREDFPQLVEAIEHAILERYRTFTLAEYDVPVMQPHLPLEGVTVFTANRMGERGIDVPLLRSAHEIPEPAPERHWLASFIGHPKTSPRHIGTRQQMFAELEGHADCYLEGDNHGPAVFVELLRSSYVALAPRGDGAQSFRLYEAMQIGTVPLYLSDIDARPFRRWIDWDGCSLYRANCDGLYDYLRGLCKIQLLDMGRHAARVWREDLQYGRWCKYVVKELGRL